MEQLRQTYLRLARRVAAMGSTGRMIAGAMAAAVVGGLWFLLTHAGGDGKALLLDGRTFNGAEITAAQQAFAAAGLNDAQVQGNQIRVPTEKESAYVAALAEGDVLPADFNRILEKTLGEMGPFVGPQQRQEIIKNAKQRELANIIRAMEGIENAAVLYDRRRQGGLSRQELITASVTVWPEPGATLAGRKTEAIRQLVTKAIAGLSPRQVSIINGKSGLSLNEPVDEGRGSYLAALREYQQLVESQVLKALAYVPRARVAANVQLAPSAGRTQPRETEHQPAELAPTKVTVAVAVPMDYYETIYQNQIQQGSPPAGDAAQKQRQISAIQSQEEAKIRRLVAKAVPSMPGGTEVDKQVEVASFLPPAVPQPDPAAPVVDTFGWLGTRETILTLAGLSAVVLLLIGVVAVRRIANSSHDRANEVSGETIEVNIPEEPPDGDSLLLDSPQASPLATRSDELARFVREDPGKAAGLIKGWIGG